MGHVVSSTEATSEVPNGFFEFDDGTKISAPIGMTEEGQKILRWLLEEHKKRDPEIYCPQMLVKESFKGAGISEVFGNMVCPFFFALQNRWAMIALVKTYLTIAFVLVLRLQ